MIVLLSCFMNLLGNNDSTRSSTGERTYQNDSVLISYEDIKLANIKLIESKFIKDKNVKLEQMIHNDSIIIDNYIRINNDIKQSFNKIKVQRNVAIGVTACLLLITICLFVK